MTTQKFIAKQHVKYYWKVLTNSVRQDTTDVISSTDTSDSFWEFEQTPREIVG